MAVPSSSSASSLSGVGGPSRQAIVPPRSSSVAPALFFDSFLELCPSIESLTALARSNQDESTKLTRLERALLHICSHGKVNLLAWFLETREQGQRATRSTSYERSEEERIPEERLFSRVDLRAIRDEESGTGLVNIAASACHTGVVELLVDHGCDVDERDPAGWTPLMWAINLGNLPLVTFLLQHGADVEARSNNGRTCEDFIVSLAPLDESSNANDACGAEAGKLEQIADAVFEYLMAAVARRERKEGSVSYSYEGGGSLRSAFSGGSFTPVSTPSSGFATKRSSAMLDGTMTSDSLQNPSLPSRTRARTLKHQPSTWSISSTSRRLVGRNERNDMQEAELRAREMAEGRRRALLDVAVMLEVEYPHLVGVETDPSAGEGDLVQTSWAVRKGKARRREGSRHPAKVQLAGLSPGCGALEVGSDPLSAEFDFNRILPDQMLVLGGNDVDPLLDLLILESKPMRAPWSCRAEPANVIYLALRSAAKYEDDDVFTSLLFGTLERVEDRIQQQEAELTHLAFWLFNLTLLWHYLQRDAILSRLPHMEGEYLHFVADLINETYVILIRDIERRLNRMIEPAMLEHEPLPLFEDVRFEGEWGFMKSLTGSVKGAVAGSTSSTTSPARNRLSQIFAKKEAGTPSPSGLVGRQSLSASHLGSFRTRSPQSRHSQEMKEPGSDASAAELLAKPTPRTVTSLLTSALHVLQLYEINPATIIQAFSQIFYWLASELFNRVLTNKRYLCRSKAMQLKLNVSALEDWTRSNALPLSIVSTHLAPLNQLISWLACQSSLKEFDSLIATMQGLKSLNPVQMKRAVKDYRYEVSESRMSDECLQYLDQLQTDWERRQEMADEADEERRVRKDLDAMKQEFLRQEVGATKESTVQHERSGTATQSDPDPPSPTESGVPPQLGSDSDEDGEATQRIVKSPMEVTSVPDPESPEGETLAAQGAIDSLFSPGRSMADYQPPLAPGPSRTIPVAQRDLLHSSAMLPFAMPSGVEALIVSPGDAFGFGRGHFTGTGTPSLRSVRAGSNAASTAALTTSHRSRHGTSGSSSSSGFTPLSRTGSPTKPSSSLSHEPLTIADGLVVQLDDHLTDDGSDSLVSGVSGVSADTNRSIFTTGKGLAAGGYWQPVPILSEETLEKFDRLMEDQKRKWDMMRARGRMRIPSGSILGNSPIEPPMTRNWGVSLPGTMEGRMEESPRESSTRQAVPPPAVITSLPKGQEAEEATSSVTLRPPERDELVYPSTSPSPKTPLAELQGLALNGHPPNPHQTQHGQVVKVITPEADDRHASGLSTKARRPPLPRRTLTAERFSDAYAGREKVKEHK